MVNEKRLIDAYVLNSELIERQYRDQTMGILHTPYPHFRAIVANQPTVDAVEVEHGRWEEAGFDGHGDYKECCSNCKSWSIGDDKLYCPVCGAKMDGDS